MAYFDAKPDDPEWQDDEAPAGCRLYMPLVEGSGNTVRDFAGSNHGSFVGSPSWQSGLYGPQIGGFSTSNYVAIDPPAQLLGATYPFWMAALTVKTGITAGYSLAQGNSAGTQSMGILHNSGNSSLLAWQVRNDAGNLRSVSATVGNQSDGRPHVVMCVSPTASVRNLYFDGQLVGTNAAALGAITCDTLTIGAIRNATVTNAFTGSLLWAGCGSGSVPDPLALANDLLSGQFSAIRPRSRPALLAAGTSGGTTSVVYARRGRSFRTGSRGLS
ncbi:LamG-like jellyroll fold domain-containing protein [Singulisphaera sp. Ch08]|uniref:LamG-like jellyroll fold domain-containing protein n=1 Tax=Singulisphaera sp. Ch08 TaxID=3120278 RepID=A0AAU7CMY7_9BACT